MKCLLFIVLLSTLQLTTFAQQKKYANLVLEGGGVRGFAYAGAFEVLDSLGLLQPIERVGGTSAGAIQATLLAIGYTPKEIMTVASNIPLKEFNDGFLLTGFTRIKQGFGFYKGNNITRWIEQLINAKTGDPNITFQQLHNLRSTKKYKDLYITGTDLTYRCLRVFSYETYPNMLIKDALRISFSIPLYFEPLTINDAGMVVKSKESPGFHLMVDGGLASNYPIQMFDSTKYVISDSSVSNSYQLNRNTIGLLLDKPEQIAYANNNYPLKIRSLKEYLTAVYLTIVDKPNPDIPTLRRTISISHLNLSGRVRKLPPATIQRLVESGRQGVRAFFKV